MTLEHAAVLKSYSIHITRHRAGTYNGDLKHVPNQNMYRQNKLCLKYVPGTSIHFTRTLRSILHPCVPGACGGNKIITNTDDKAKFHTYEWKFSRHLYTKFTAGAKRNCSYYVSQGHVLAGREFFVPNDFTSMFCHCNMYRQSSFD